MCTERGCRGAKFLLVSEVSAVFLCAALSAASGSPQRPGLPSRGHKVMSGHSFIVMTGDGWSQACCYPACLQAPGLSHDNDLPVRLSVAQG